MRRRYYRSRRIYPKQKWSINTNQVIVLTGATNVNSYSVASSNIILNPSRTGNTGDSLNVASQILKTARVKFKGIISSAMNAFQSTLIAIMYIPEGINPAIANDNNANIGSSIFYTHPEWIISWTRVDYTNAAQKNEISMTSKLKRNLNPGDSIRLIVYNFNNAAQGQVPSVDVVGTCSYCVRSN